MGNVEDGGDDAVLVVNRFRFARRLARHKISVTILVCGKEICESEFAVTNQGTALLDG